MPTPLQLYKPGQKIVGELNERLVPVGFKATPQEAVTEWVKPREDHYGTDTTLSAEKFAELQETEAGMAGRPTSPWSTFSPTSQLYKDRELPVFLIEEMPRPETTSPTAPTAPTAPTTTTPTSPTTTTPSFVAPPQQVVSTAVTPTDTPTFGQTSPLLAAQQSRTRQRSRRRRRPTREADSFLGGGQTLGAG
jgi:hypothetical protein